MRKSILAVLVLFLAIAYFISQKSAPSAQSVSTDVVWVNQIKNLIISQNKDDSSADSASNDNSKNQNESIDVDNLADLSEQQLDLWIESEAGKMDLTNNDSETQSIQLRAKALTVTNAQMHSLIIKALDGALPINQRIFSAYFVTLTSNSITNESMENIAAQGLTNFGAPVPHSEAELKRSQELALKYMQVDELFQRAKIDSEAKERLKKLASSAGSDEVRTYAKKKLSELK